jgi:O-antigen ligase
MKKIKDNYIRYSNFYFFILIFILPLAYIFSPALLNCITIILVVHFLFFKYLSNSWDWTKNYFFLFIIIFWLYLILQSLFYPKSFISSFGYIRFLLLPFVISFLLKENEKHLNKLNHFFIIIVFLVAFDVLWQFYNGKDLLGYRADYINNILGYNFSDWKTHQLQRFSGPFGKELIAGTFLLIFGSLVFFFNLDIKKNRLFILYSFLLFVIFSLIATGDRSAFIMLLYALLFNIFFNKKINKKNSFFILFAIFLFFLLILNFSKTVNYRFIGNVLENTNKNISTFSLEKIKQFYHTAWGAHYLTSLEMIKTNPFFGTGLRSYRFECQKYDYIDSRVAKIRCTTHPHNTALELLSETGIFGFILFFFIILNAFFFENKKNNQRTFFIFSLILAVIFPIKPTGALFSTWFGSIIWLLLGFYLFEKKRIKQ